MVLVLLMTDNNRWKIETRGQESLEVGANYASKTDSDISPVYRLFKGNLIPIVFKPIPIKFYFVETSFYHITYYRFLSPGIVIRGLAETNNIKSNLFQSSIYGSRCGCRFSAWH
jgi:hypothetical protein